jgi:hypothetical protein
MKLAVLAVLVAASTLTIMLEGPAVRAGTPPATSERKAGQATLPADAAEGPRDLAALAEPLRRFVTGQPFGKTYREITPTEPPPKDKTGIGEAETHPDLRHDPIEVQQQVQYLEETPTQLRYGWVAIRGLRAYRYGKLAAVQLVLERIGRDEAGVPRWKEDALALAEAWKDLGTALGLGPGYQVVRNDLVEQRKKGTFPSAPLRIEIAPARGGER